MENVFGVLVLISLILLIIGIINPKISLFWYRKDKTKKISMLFYGILLIFSFILFNVFINKTTTSDNEKLMIQIKKDSINNKNSDSIELIKKKNLNPKAAMIQKEFPNWSADKCSEFEKYEKINPLSAKIQRNHPDWSQTKCEEESIWQKNNPESFIIQKQNPDWTNEECEIRANWEKKNPKAASIQKNHKDWTDNECIMLSKGQIWIGMSIQMVVYLRGLPNHKNVSNYGRGLQYQYCWDGYTSSCFYTYEDQIVYSYN